MIRTLEGESVEEVWMCWCVTEGVHCPLSTPQSVHKRATPESTNMMYESNSYIMWTYNFIEVSGREYNPLVEVTVNSKERENSENFCLNYAQEFGLYTSL
jgi:hypothetical protein